MQKSLLARAFIAVAAIGAAMFHIVNDALFGYMANVGMVSFVITKAPTYTGQLPIRTQPVDQAILEVAVPFDYPAANPANGDSLVIANVPAGVEIVDWAIVSDDADSNGAPALAFTVGSLNAALTGLTTTYKAGLTVAQTGGIDRPTLAAHWLEASTAARAIGLLFTVAAATYVAGKKGLLVLKLRA